MGRDTWGKGPKGIAAPGVTAGPDTLPSCSLVNELAFTARKMMADEALSSGLVR